MNRRRMLGGLALALSLLLAGAAWTTKAVAKTGCACCGAACSCPVCVCDAQADKSSCECCDTATCCK